MTPSTLQAIRSLLFFSVDEAAELVGGVTPRSWQYWERGQRTIPQDVIDTLRGLCDWRQRAIDAALAQIETLRQQHGETKLTLVWYPTREAWLARKERDPLIYWRPHCSVVAHLAATDPLVVLM